METPEPWFAKWFDSPFYHILYGNHDQEEANSFIRKLVTFLKPLPNSVFCDLACGKGRHSRALRNLGFHTYGLDLSNNSIDFARQFEDDRLHFYVHDMREVFEEEKFDYILNLFTSFGYFDNQNDLLKTLKAVNTQLKEYGILLIDYMNVSKIKKSLKQSVTERIHRNGIDFHIKKTMSDGFVLKQIKFNHDRGAHQYTERVAAIELEDFQGLLENTNFKIQTILGDYQLNPYDAGTSDRLIIIAEKI